MENINDRQLESMFIKSFNKEISDEINNHLLKIKKNEMKKSQMNKVIPEIQTFSDMKSVLSDYLISESHAYEYGLHVLHSWHVFMKVFAYDIDLITDSENQNTLMPHLTIFVNKEHIELLITATSEKSIFKFNSKKFKFSYAKIDLVKCIVSSIFLKRLEIANSINDLFDYYYVNSKNKTIAENGIIALCTSIFANTSIRFRLLPNFDNPFVLTIRFTDKDEESICAANFNVIERNLRYKQFCLNPQEVMFILQEIKTKMLSQ